MLVSGGQEKVNFEKVSWSVALRPQKPWAYSRKGGTGAQDSHLNFYTAPEPWTDKKLSLVVFILSPDLMLMASRPVSQ